MTGDVPLVPGEDAFPLHIFDALGLDPVVFKDRIGGSVMVIEKRPDDGPVTILTSGVSRIPNETDERIELAVEVVDGQQGAAMVALRMVINQIAINHRTPPVLVPWRNDEPFLTGTAISALLVTPSRWGASFDEVRNEAGEVVGHVRTLRLLTDGEAAVAGERGWDALVAEVGSVEALLDVERAEQFGNPGVQ
ncbi:suppressor of fused domain protein [Plantibacter sp. ME-Dv--P-122b]|uniref:suppressor of fused domain protein n=1 Tax=Plantibacter sp. ME-Dv--P-122b TaxID=3040300 RepID=UPI00254C2F53|nr:suppressor of fused domain protein [Plantibacter sp. ME-Dv--P-122b]